jgi:hypothetical protein
MTRHHLSSASCAWLALMGIVWTLFVPKGLSVGTFSLFCLAGHLSLLAAARALGLARPARSMA